MLVYILYDKYKIEKFCGYIYEKVIQKYFLPMGLLCNIL